MGAVIPRLWPSYMMLLCDPLSFSPHEEERLAVREFWVWARKDESSLHQKSWVQWLSLGDHNFAFFHRSVRGWVVRNELASLTDVAG